MPPDPWRKERFRPDHQLNIGLTPLFVLRKADSEFPAAFSFPLLYRVVEALHPKPAWFLMGGNWFGLFLD
jgi:hypothetical protein